MSYNVVEREKRVSYNNGLEKLNSVIEKSETHQINLAYNKEEIPGMEILEKFYPFNLSDFHFRWSSMVFVCNLYNYFTVAYFLGIKGFPSGFWLVLELTFETILILDIIVRISLRSTSLYKKMWFLHEKNSIETMLCIFLSSIPYSFLCLIYGQDLSDWSIALTRVPKLLRGMQVHSYFTNIQIIRRSTGWLFALFIKYLIAGLIINHYAAMTFLLVERIESNNGITNNYTHYLESGTSSYILFIYEEFWALGSLCSAVMSDILPLNISERILSVFFMIIGGSVFGAVFGKIVTIMEKKSLRKVEKNQKLNTAKNWITMRKISSELKLRVLNYYNYASEKFGDVIQYEFLDELPLSLRTEISLYLHRDLIPKVKIFEFGDPGFMMGIVRHLKPKLYIAGDYIIRQGDYAEEFYFIRLGGVEVLSTDGETSISILEEGAYFGEIGILLGVCRTVSVRAITATLTSSIHKDHLMNILNNFPEHLVFLKKVAEQRLMTTNIQDFDINFDLLEENSDYESLSSEDSEEEYYAPTEHKNKSWIERFITVENSKAIRGLYQIDAFSYFFYIWSGLLNIGYLFYLLYIPFAISFDYEGGTILMWLDYMSYIIYILDIFVSLNSSLMTDFGNYIHDTDEIRKNYIDKYLLIDFLAIIPVDFISDAYDLPLSITIISKSVRLLKFKRIYQICKLLNMNGEYSLSIIKVFIYAPVFVYLSHLTSCLFFLLCRVQYLYYNYIQSSQGCFISEYTKKTGINFLDMPTEDQYYHFMFFACCVFSSNSYNVIMPISPAEQLFCCFAIMVSRLLLAFLLAEASTFMKNMHKPYVYQLAKFNLVKEWMEHYKLPENLKKRIINHYNLIWVKLKGVDDQEIIKDLPESLRIDISYYLFSGLITSGLLPHEEQGAIRSIIQKCRVSMQCSGEEIISEGELGLDLYFVLEGEVEVVTSDKIVLDTLRQGSVLGEMALLTPFATLRTATAIAKTDVSLAVLSIEDFNFVMKIYPDFARKVRIQASRREEMNKKIIHSANLNALKIHKKLSFVLKKSDDLPLINFNTKYEPDNDLSNEVIIKSKIFKYFFGFHTSIVKHPIYMVNWFWNLVYVPLQLGFKYNPIDFIVPELFSTIIYTCFGFYYFYLWMCISNLPEQIRNKDFSNVTKNLALFKCIHHTILSLPYFIIFSGSININGFMLIFSLIRISNYYYLFEVIEWVKKKLIFFNFIRVLEVILHFTIISHIVACIFIDMASWGSENWISYHFESPQQYDQSDLSIYLIACYWALTCFSHGALGDIIPVSRQEIIYNSIVCLIGCFLYALLFGNISSLVSEFALKFRSKLLESYNFVIDFIKKKKVGIAFGRQVDDYFNFLWESNKENIDSEILKQLPSGIMSDVQAFRYSAAIGLSKIFNDSEGNLHTKLARTFFRNMEIQYYLTGDTIIRPGDKNQDSFFILEGEVDIIDLKGDKVIDTLNSGSYFGEINFLLDIPIRIFSAIAPKISQIGVVRKDSIEKMVISYPEWKEYLIQINKQKLVNLFGTSNTTHINDIITELNQKIHNNSNIFRKYNKKAEILIAPKMLGFLNNPVENQWFKMSVIHLLLIIYSVFAIPIQIAFNYTMTKYVLYLEFFILIESFAFFLITFRYTILVKAEKKMEYKDFITLYYKNYLIEDIIAFSPFNLLFPAINIENPKGIIIILRMLRLLCVTRIPSLMQKIEIYIRGIDNIFGPLKAIFFLVMLMNWCSCLWYYLVSLETAEYTWMDLVDIRNSQYVSIKLVASIYYVMNFATGTGYSDSYPCTLIEIFLTLLFILFGNIIFAVAFGLIASLVLCINSHIRLLLENLKKVLEVLKKSEVPNNIISRLEAYYIFNDSIKSSFGHLDCKVLYNHLPKNIVNKITYECNRHILKKMPFFGENDFVEMIEKISLHMVPKIYLPNDYIIYKNDVGEEMYFIIIGSVDILSSDNNNKVIKTLCKGDYFGEVALIHDSKRMCSVVANSLSLLYLLMKQDFQDIIKDYPKAIEILTKESNKRQAETNLIKENEKRNMLAPSEEDCEDANESIVKTLNFYSAISNPFFGPQPQSMNFLTGMNNVNSELAIESYANGNKETKLYKRRPNIEFPQERRYSQESLSKEIVLSNFSKMKMQWIVEGN
jgi:CRP-like cAMP-binding protein